MKDWGNEMKKICKCAIAAALAPLAASAVDVASETFGVMKVSLTKQTSAVSIPFCEPGSDDAAVALNTLVQRANLPEGTKAYIYSDTDGKYDIYVLNSSKAWVAADSTTIGDDSSIATETTTAVAQKTIASGRGFFIVLPTANSYSQDLYLSGQVLGTAPSVTVPAGGLRLVSPSSTASGAAASVSKAMAGVTYSVKKSSTSPKLTEIGDSIQIVLASGEVRTYYCFENVGWQYYDQSSADFASWGWAPTEGGALEIPAGTAFWFKNAAVSEKTLTFE